VLAGGWLSDRARTLNRQLGACTAAALLVIVAAPLLLLRAYLPVLWGIPLYFLLSGVVTAIGFAALVAVTPASRRGLAIAVSFFLNVAVGGGVGPTAVALAQDGLFGAGSGLAPAIGLVIVSGYLLVLGCTLAARAAAGRRAAAFRAAPPA